MSYRGVIIEEKFGRQKIFDKFIEEKKKDDNILGIILFGSWARGDNRPDSDYDLLIITKDKFLRTIEVVEEANFEITYNTYIGTMNYWKDNKDDAAILWAVAKIIYDKDGTIEKLKLEAEKLLSEGKTPLSSDELKHLSFDADDQIAAVSHIAKTDTELANFVLTNKIFGLTELYFDIRGIWTPPPKQRFKKIAKIDSDFAVLLYKYYTEPNNITNKIEIAKQIIEVVFNKQ
jgi:predicted nucleotidyltransferase